MQSWRASKRVEAGIAVGIGMLSLGLLLWLTLRALLRPHKRMSFKRRHCIITGGSSGIGKEVAMQLAREGAHITIIARNVPRLEAALADIKACAANPTQQQFASVSLTLGASDFSAVQAAFDSAQAALGPCAALINVAGFAVPQAFDELPVADLEGMLRTNLLAGMHAARAVVPGMKQRGEGRILFTSSIAGLAGLYGYTAYAASKFGLRGFAEALQMELKAYHVAVCVAYPPDTDTPGFAEENKLKDPVTARIAATAPVFNSTAVAASIVRGLAAGHFSITTGVDGWLMSLVCAGFSPAQSVRGALCSALAAGVLRVASFVYLWRWYGFVQDGAKAKLALVKQQQQQQPSDSKSDATKDQ